MSRVSRTVGTGGIGIDGTPIDREYVTQRKPIGFPEGSDRIGGWDRGDREVDRGQSG